VKALRLAECPRYSLILNVNTHAHTSCTTRKQRDRASRTARNNISAQLNSSRWLCSPRYPIDSTQQCRRSAINTHPAIPLTICRPDKHRVDKQMTAVPDPKYASRRSGSSYRIGQNKLQRTGNMNMQQKRENSNLEHWY